MKIKFEYSQNNGNYIMNKDLSLLNNLNKETSVILHFHDWEPASISYGCFIKPENHFTKNALNQFIFTKRPSGGGIIFHDYTFCLSILMHCSHPKYSHNKLLNYETINNTILEAILDLFPEIKCNTEAENSPALPFCMAKPTKYDILVGGKKLVGAAQRHKENVLLHQTSIFIELPPNELLNEILLDSTVYDAIYQNSITLPPLKGLKEKLTQSIISSCKKSFIYK